MMLKVKYLFFLNFFVCTNVVVVGQIPHKLVFQIENVDNLLEAVKTIQSDEFFFAKNYSFFSKMVISLRRRLCMDAKKYALLDVMDPNEDILDEKLYFYRQNTLIHCNTLPTSYLRYERPIGNIVILIESRFNTVKFDYETIESNPVSCLDSLKNDFRYFDMDIEEFNYSVQVTCFDDEILKKSRIAKLSESDRLHLCISAKRSLSQFLPRDRLPSIQTDGVEVAQMFEIQNRNVRWKRATIRCPSSPPMYLHYINLRINFDVQILLVATGDVEEGQIRNEASFRSNKRQHSEIEEILPITISNLNTRNTVRRTELPPSSSNANTGGSGTSMEREPNNNTTLVTTVEETDVISESPTILDLNLTL